MRIFKRIEQKKVKGWYRKSAWKVIFEIRFFAPSLRGNFRNSSKL